MDLSNVSLFLLIFDLIKYLCLEIIERNAYSASQEGLKDLSKIRRILAYKYSLFKIIVSILLLIFKWVNRKKKNKYAYKSFLYLKNEVERLNLNQLLIHRQREVFLR